jgi:predicted regulator of amino acid metabolism with ACT domain
MKNWSPEELKRLNRYIARKVAICKIAKFLDRPYSSVYQKINQIKNQKRISYQKSNILLDLIMKVVADFYNFKVIDIIQKNRAEEVRIPRQICHVLAKNYTKFSNADIGYYIGKLNHSTVSNSRKKIKQYLEVDKVFRREFEKLDTIVQLKIKNLNTLNSINRVNPIVEIKASIIGIHNKIIFNELIKELKNG